MVIMPKKTVNCPRCGHHESEHLSIEGERPLCYHKNYGPPALGDDGWWRQSPVLQCDCDLSVEDIYINLKMRGKL